MKNHTKTYFKALGYDTGDPTQFIPSEWSGNTAKDIHHIVDRTDRIENLMALTRMEHHDMGDKKIYMVSLLMAHRQFLKENNVPFENEWFEENIRKYDGQS